VLRPDRADHSDLGSINHASAVGDAVDMIFASARMFSDPSF